MESQKDDYDAALDDDDPGESFVPQREVLESADKETLLTLQPANKGLKHACMHGMLMTGSLAHF